VKLQSLLLASFVSLTLLIEEKTGVELVGEIMKIFEPDGLPLVECGGQSYDNNANMVGVYKGTNNGKNDIVRSV
jgi:hypothetical protein